MWEGIGQSNDFSFKRAHGLTETQSQLKPSMARGSVRSIRTLSVLEENKIESQDDVSNSSDPSGSYKSISPVPSPAQSPNQRDYKKNAQSLQ